MSFNDFSSLVTPRTMWGVVADFLWLPVIMYLLLPQQIFLTGTLDRPWSRSQMGCESAYLCLTGYGWVLSWWHLWLAILVGAASCFIVRYAFVQLSLMLERAPRSLDLQASIDNLTFPHYC